MSFLQFMLEISNSLMYANKPSEIEPKKKRGRPANIIQESNSPQTSSSGSPFYRRKKISDEIRFDGVGHIPVHLEKERFAQRCKHCSTGFTKIKCQKCDLSLCLTSERNCFSDFHHNNNN